MATAIATPNWRIQFQRQSVTDNRIFTFTATVVEFNEDDCKSMVAYLKKLGYANVEYRMLVVIP